MSKFWDKAEKCKHENISDSYCQNSSCMTPYCGGAYEWHCLDCGVYFSECDCHSSDGVSGWSSRRWKKYELKNRGK